MNIFFMDILYFSAYIVSFEQRQIMFESIKNEFGVLFIESRIESKIKVKKSVIEL